MEDDDADGSFPRWVSLEYSHMRSLLAAPAPPFSSSSSPFRTEASSVLFSSLAKSSVSTLRSSLDALASSASSQAPYQASDKSVLELMQERGVALERVCLLDPKGPQELAPADGDSFDWFLCVISHLRLLTASWPAR